MRRFLSLGKIICRSIERLLAISILSIHPHAKLRVGIKSHLSLSQGLLGRLPFFNSSFVTLSHEFRFDEQHTLPPFKRNLCFIHISAKTIYMLHAAEILFAG